MPKPLLFQPKTNEKQGSLLSARNKTRNQNKQLSKLEINRILRKKRSKSYIDMMTKLDAGGHVCNQHEVEKLLEAITSEFPEILISGELEGIVSKCYLGSPYEVHSLDIAGNIVYHYERSEVMPGKLEMARSLAIYGNYAFIEVYTNCLRAVSREGDVSVI